MSLVLDLRQLRAQAWASPTVVDHLTLAASVMLKEIHGPRNEDPATVLRRPQATDATIHRTSVEAADERWLGDPKRTAEFGGEAVGIITAYQVLRRAVAHRAVTDTGCDYWVRDVDAPKGHPLERLELSGIGLGSETTSSRVRKKYTQLETKGSGEAGFAIVTNFHTNPVQVAIEDYA